MVIVLDALNQLATGMSDLGWLPAALPRNVKVVVSAIETWRDEGIVSYAMRPFAEAADRRRLVDAYLSRHLKQLDESALETLIAFPGTANPLYLKIVLSELRVFGSGAEVTKRIREGFGETPGTAFDAVLQRLEHDPSYTPLHPDRAVPLLFGLLGHARSGLRHDDLVELMMRYYPHQVRVDVQDTVNVCLRQVRPFLARRSGRDDFFHESFKAVAAQRYAGREPWHRMLATHFSEKAKLSPLAKVTNLCDLRISGDIESLLQKRWMKSLPNVLFGGSIDPTNMVMELHDLFRNIVKVDMETQAQYLESLHTDGFCMIPSLTQEEALRAVERVVEYGLEAAIEPAAERRDTQWLSEEPWYFSELLHHQVAGSLWSDLLDVLTNAEFIARSMKLLGPRSYIERFHEFVRRVSANDETRPLLDDLRMRMPVDDYTVPLMRDLADGFTSDPEEAARFVLLCAQDQAHHERAIVGLRALLEIARKTKEPWPDPVRDRLKNAMPMLLKSSRKRARWEALHAWWSLVPDADPKALLAIATSQDEHLLVRAEAARQLGQSANPAFVPALRTLAASSSYPLRTMAAQSIRWIEMEAGIIPRGPIDNGVQPKSLPTDLRPLLRALGVNASSINLGAWKEHAQLLIHVVQCNSLSVESRWNELEIIDTVIRNLPCHLVCSEAGWGDCSLTPMKEIASTETWARVAPKFFYDLMLQSEEYLQLVSDLSYKIQGIDDPALTAEIMDEKWSGRRATMLVASVARAQGMLGKTLTHLRAADPPVTLLITSELPAQQIARLLGEEKQIDPERLFERFLPEARVPRDLVNKRADLVYVVIRVPEPSGDVFGTDINYVHALGLQSGPSAAE